MEKSKPMTSENIIEEILYQASEAGLLHEVLDEAKKILEQNSKIDRALAYQMAYDEWVK